MYQYCCSSSKPHVMKTKSLELESETWKMTESRKLVFSSLIFSCHYGALKSFLLLISWKFGVQNEDGDFSSCFSFPILSGVPFLGGRRGVILGVFFWAFLGGRGFHFLGRIFFWVWHISFGLLLWVSHSCILSDFFGRGGRWVSFSQLGLHMLFGLGWRGGALGVCGQFRLSTHLQLLVEGFF